MIGTIISLRPLIKVKVGRGTLELPYKPGFRIGDTVVLCVDAVTGKVVGISHPIDEETP